MKRVDYENRVIAFLIDYALSFILTTIIICLLAITPFLELKTMVKYLVQICGLVFFLYICFSYALFDGVSLGGLIMNVKIVNKDGSRMLIQTIIVRALLLSLMILALYNIFYMLFKRTQEAIYDKATETIAIMRVNIEN